jgi:hypothetical protein
VPVPANWSVFTVACQNWQEVECRDLGGGPYRVSRGARARLRPCVEQSLSSLIRLPWVDSNRGNSIKRDKGDYAQQLERKPAMDGLNYDRSRIDRRQGGTDAIAPGY